jgi:hypothetical protein
MGGSTAGRSVQCEQRESVWALRRSSLGNVGPGLPLRDLFHFHEGIPNELQGRMRIVCDVGLRRLKMRRTATGREGGAIQVGNANKINDGVVLFAPFGT